MNSNIAYKSRLRLIRSINLMKRYPGQYNCKNCIHGLTESCTDNLKNGCEYFEDLINNRSFMQEHRNFNTTLFQQDIPYIVVLASPQEQTHYIQCAAKLNYNAKTLFSPKTIILKNCKIFFQSLNPLYIVDLGLFQDPEHTSQTIPTKKYRLTKKSDQYN